MLEKELGDRTCVNYDLVKLWTADGTTKKNYLVQ